ncbi:MAG: hypothetical protein IJZ74_08515 [Clostridia bacterium]|nr:hypothetical protein [Clostridia bacterium]
MPNTADYLDDLLTQVAAGHMLPQDALQAFFLHKKRSGDTILTEEDNAFISAMDTVEVAHIVAKWCARTATAIGGVQAIEADLRRPTFFHPRRRPPLITAVDMRGRKTCLFSPDAAQAADAGQQEDCLHVCGSFSEAAVNPAFLPVFRSALTTAVRAHGLPEPQYLQ